MEIVIIINIIFILACFIITSLKKSDSNNMINKNNIIKKVCISENPKDSLKKFIKSKKPGFLSTLNDNEYGYLCEACLVNMYGDVCYDAEFKEKPVLFYAFWKEP